MMRVVVALGGNALLERGEQPEAAVQHRHVRRAAQALAPLAADHELIICHGNGPQVGMLAVESEADPAISHPYPLDALGAQTQGLIGYWLAQELRNAGVVWPVLAVVTQTIVDREDPAFAAPTKFIGPMYRHHHAQRLAAERQWQVRADGAGWRRVVPSPDPQRIVELPLIHDLVAARAVVICAGGGGAPVIENEAGQLTGVDAVIDKDLAAAMLADDLHADALVLLTDVPAVFRGFGTDHATPIRRICAAELAQLDLPAGSMGPKVEACRRFVRHGQRTAAIGALADAAAVLDGRAGTQITAGSDVTLAGSSNTGRRT